MANESPIINYTNRNFDKLRADLINYVKTRFPDKFTYFNDASSDMLYLEMLAYVGDTLNFSIDRAFNENFKLTAQSRESIFRIADNLGFYEYYAKPSITQATLSINVPATVNEDGSSLIPHPNYIISINQGLVVSSSNGVNFECLEEVNFANENLRSIVPNFDANGQVIDFKINKTVKLYAGETKYQRFYVEENSSKPFLEIFLEDEEVSEVISIVEVVGNSYETPRDEQFRDYNNSWLPVSDLSEDKIFVSLHPDDNNEVEIKEVINAYTDMSINYGKWVNKPKRFIVRRDNYGRTKLLFGNNLINRNQWENLIGSVDLSSLSSFSINQILNNNALGEIPKLGTTLFIKYRKGAGVKTNVLENDIKTIISKSYRPTLDNLDYALISKVKNSLKVDSNLPAIGGYDEMTNDEMKQTIGKIYSANQRIVTYPDIVNMLLAMPPEYGRPFRVSYEEIKPKVLTYSKIQNYVNKQLEDLKSLSLQTERENKIFEIQNFLDTVQNLPIDIINNKIISYQEGTENVLDNVNTLWLGEKCNLYILGIDKDLNPTSIYKDSKGVFKSANAFLKRNMKEFLVNKKLIGDWINIVDANVIDFQIEFKIIADNKNKQRVLIDCLNKLRNYFNVYNWNINQPIYASNVQTILQEVEGVINVVEINFFNQFGIDLKSGKKYSEQETGTYFNNDSITTNVSNNRFKMNLVNNVILSRPSDFLHIRYPDDDIIGYVV